MEGNTCVCVQVHSIWENSLHSVHGPVQMDIMFFQNSRESSGGDGVSSTSVAAAIWSRPGWTPPENLMKSLVDFIN
jgi:hypothetical protein